MRPHLKSVGLMLMLWLSAPGMLPVPLQDALAQTQSTVVQNRKAEADRLLEKGNKLRQQNQFQAALETLQKALTIYREIQDGKGEGTTLKDIGNVFLAQKNYAKTIDYQQQALKIAREIKDADLEARALNNLGLAYLDAGDAVKGVEYYQQASQIAEKIPNRSLQLSALLGIANASHSLASSEADYQKVLELAQQGLKLAQNEKDRSNEARALAILGMTYYSLKDFPKAIEFAQQEVAAAKEAKDWYRASVLLNAIGDIYNDSLKEHSKAIEYYQQASQIAEKIPNRSLQLSALLGIANASHSLASSEADYQKVLELAQQGLKLARDEKDRSKEARALAILGMTYYSLKDFPKAIEFDQKGVAAAKEAKEGYRASVLLNAIGDIYNDSLKEHSKAIEYYQQASQIAEKIPNRSLQLSALLGIANASHSLASSEADYQKVLELAQQGLKLARDEKDRSKEARALAVLGMTYYSLKDFPKAIEFDQQGVAAAKEAKDWYRASVLLNAIGDIYNDSLKEHSKAIEYYQQASQIAEKIPNRSLQLSALLGIANASHSLASSEADYQKVLELAQQGLKLARDEKDRSKEARALAILGMTYNSLKDFPKAIESYQKGVAAAKEAKEGYHASVLLNAIGDIYRGSLKEYREAIEYYQQASQIAEKIPNRSLQLSALLGIANASHSLASSEADYQKVLELAQQGLKLARDEKDRSKEARALAILGMTYNSLNDFPKAIEFFQQGVAAAKEAKEGYRASVLLNAISSIYYSSLRDYTKGIDYAQQALSLAQTIQNVDAEANALKTLSDVYEVLGDDLKSLEYAQKLKTIAQKTNNRELESQAYIFLTSAYYGQHNPRVEEIARQSLIVAQNSKNPALEALAIWCLGWLAADSGDYTKAIEFAQRSLTIARNTQNRNLEGTAQRLLGNIYRKQGKVDQAIAAYRAALALSGDNADYRSKVGLAEVYQDLHMPVTAIAYYKLAINQIETVRSKIRELSPDLQQSFLQNVTGFNRQRITDVYRQLADLLLSQGRIAEAQQVLELLRIKELDEFTRTARSGEKSQSIALSQVEANVLKEHGTLVAFGQKLTECQSTRNATCDTLRDQLTALTAQYNQAVRTLEKELSARPSVDKEFIDPESQFGKAAANLIKENPGTLLIYPLVLEDKLWLLMAGQGGVLKKFEVNVSRKQLSETVRQFRDLLQTPNSDLAQLQTTSQQLYTWLIQPLEAELKTKNANQPAIHNLVFSLDRVTRYIPMAALFDGKQYLIENYTVSTLVATSFGNNRDRNPLTPQTSQVLALGVSQARGFPPLPNVKAELDAIVRNPNNDNKGIYPGQEFIDQAFDFRAMQNNLNGHRILHIATHGKFEPGDPYASYLVMGKGDQLKIADIQNLPNLGDINLVTLSACETAMGGPGDGIEIAGISSFFLRQGAQAVNASLWLVNDASTSLLMQQFYRNLATGTAQAPMTKAEALRQAQLVLLKNPSLTKTNANRTVVQPITANQETRRDNQPSAPGFTHPYYWAPFILIGNSL